MIDVVYILGSFSRWQNNELRYSLRSVEKYLSGYRNVYIVGEDPGFLKGVNIIKFPDPYPDNKQRNILEKITRACMDYEISDRFLYMADDFFFLQPLAASEIKYFYEGTLEEAIQKRSPGNIYNRCLSNTIIALKSRNLPILNYDIHQPILYHKTRFLDEMKQFSFRVPYGMVIKSLYCNSIGADGVSFREVKIKNDCKNVREIIEFTHGLPFFSIGEQSTNGMMKEYLMHLYNTPSQWEL